MAGRATLRAEITYARTVSQRGATTMPLRVELKPFERIVIGESVIINSASRPCFLVDGEVPILATRIRSLPRPPTRRRKRRYLCVQTMYLKNDREPYPTACLGLLDELAREMPDCRDVIGGHCRTRVERPAVQSAQGHPQVDQARS
jgi:flagellar biosynthesis repressor protein FlbT